MEAMGQRAVPLGQEVERRVVMVVLPVETVISHR